MKAFLINLDRAADRREHMLAELARLTPEIEVERAMSVDIKDPNWKAPDWIVPGRWKSDRWSLGPSDIEIFRSHIDSWETIAASGEPGLVLEDDLLFSEDFADAIKLLAETPVKGIVRLDGVDQPLILERSSHKFGQFNLSLVGSLAASAAAYMLDAETAAELVRTVRVERTVDDYLFDPTPSDRGARGHGLPIYQLEPVIAIQAQFGHFADAQKEIPDFLLATKRVDAQNRKSREYLGPLPYRLRKEVLRTLFRRRKAKRISSIGERGGRWALPVLSADLRWDGKA